MFHAPRKDSFQVTNCNYFSRATSILDVSFTRTHAYYINITSLTTDNKRG